MMTLSTLSVVLVARHESNDEVFIKVGIKPGRDPEFAEGKKRHFVDDLSSWWDNHGKEIFLSCRSID